MTRRLYWDDAYMTTAHTSVVEVTDTAIVLDATPFHATGGGQPGDVGTIRDDVVGDTRCREDGAIVHIVEAAPACMPGDEVVATVDWNRRYGLMRHHSLLHIVHLVLTRELGDVEDLGSAIAPEKARIEYAYHGGIDMDAIAAQVSDLILQDLLATTTIAADGRRVWSIPGWPPIPCGGTHVGSLGELGMVAIRRKSAGRRGVRIYATSTPDPVGALTAS